MRITLLMVMAAVIASLVLLGQETEAEWREHQAVEKLKKRDA
ncbi:MAG: hypothetical protein ACUVTG_14420 [Candidatus Oleimicrobiaceae bacterium]